MRNVIKTLRERGLIDAMTHEELENFVEKPICLYCGFDPTNDSLHLGSMVPMMGLAWFQRFGHTPIVVLGGATGMIGDPSGKSKERQLLDEVTIKKNIEGIKRNFKNILSEDEKYATPIYLNNYDWLKQFTFLDFLRDVGKHFRLGPMLSKDSVKNRLQSPEGMSFTEFSYQVLQGYDFLYLFEHYETLLQVGGSDQWGNITAGTELVRKLKGKAAYGLSFPLLTKADGTKYGKTEKGAIWLSPEKLSQYEFFQQLFRVEDTDVIKLMKMLTFMDLEEIEHYQELMATESYIPNTAQRRLAEEVTRIVHGEEGVQIAIKVSEGAAPGSETPLEADLLQILSQDMPNIILSRKEVVNQKIIDLVVLVGLKSSKSEVRRLIQQGGMYLNNQKIVDENLIVDDEKFIEGKFMLLSTGKKNKMIIQITS